MMIRSALYLPCRPASRRGLDGSTLGTLGQSGNKEKGEISDCRVAGMDDCRTGDGRREIIHHGFWAGNRRRRRSQWRGTTNESLGSNDFEMRATTNANGPPCSHRTVSTRNCSAMAASGPLATPWHSQLPSVLNRRRRHGRLGLHAPGRCPVCRNCVASDVVKDRFTVATELKQRLGEIKEHVEEYMVRLNPPDYWCFIAFRYPAMVKFLHAQSRIGVEGDQAVVNAYLPATASHNLIFGGAMALASTPGAVAVASNSSKPAATPPRPSRRCDFAQNELPHRAAGPGPHAPRNRTLG